MSSYPIYGRVGVVVVMAVNSEGQVVGQTEYRTHDVNEDNHTFGSRHITPLLTISRKTETKRSKLNMVID